MFLKSIRFKIILWYMFLLAVTLSVFSVLLYHNFSHSLYAELDRLLESKAEGIVNSIDTYWETEKIEATKDGIRGDVFNKINNANFIKIAQRWVKESSNDPKLMNIIIQLFDSNGKNIACSKDIPGLTTFSYEVGDFGLDNQGRFSILYLDSASMDNGRVNILEKKPLGFRVLTIPVIENSRVSYIVQVSSPMGLTSTVLRNLRVILFLLLPLTVFLTGILGVFLTRQALNPVNEMIDSIHKITAENLRLRVSLPDTNDEIRRLAETFNDMLKRLEESFLCERRFVQDISHELRTPLTILKGELEVTLRNVRSAKEYEIVLQSSLDEINRIFRIVDNLLFLARFDNRDTFIKMGHLDLNMIISDTLNNMRVLAKEKDIQLDFDAQEKIILPADEKQLMHLFLNLVDNAIKYTPQNGNITLSLNKDNNLAVIKVRDTGIGIPESDLPYIFNRFYRANQSCKIQGFGLGLSIVKAIIETHKGDIKVESCPGRGSTFSVSLPLSHSE